MIEAARVVVGVDGSLSSLAAVRRGAAEARRRDAVLVPVIAWMACDGDSLRPLSELEYAARVRLESVVELAFDGVPQGVRVHPRVVRAEAGRALVAIADHPSDLLVVGSGGHTGPGGHGGPQDVPYGSVARYCRARAACEVLVVPSPGSLEPVLAMADDVDRMVDTAGHCHAGVGYWN
jgi:nucleotide-binding universal stress UspA family protein